MAAHGWRGRNSRLNLAHPSIPGLTGLLTFNEGGGVPLFQGPLADPVAPQAGATWGVSGAGPTFNLPDTFAILPNLSLLKIVPPCSFMAVFELTDISAASRFFAGGTSRYNGVFFQASATGLLAAGFGDDTGSGASNFHSFSTGVVLAANRVHAALFVISSLTSAEIYLDGLPVSASTLSGSASTVIWNTSAPNIGRIVAVTQSKARLYQMAWWDRALTAHEGTALTARPFALVTPKRRRPAVALLGVAYNDSVAIGAAASAAMAAQLAAVGATTLAVGAGESTAAQLAAVGIATLAVGAGESTAVRLDVVASAGLGAGVGQSSASQAAFASALSLALSAGLAATANAALMALAELAIAAGESASASVAFQGQVLLGVVAEVAAGNLAGLQASIALGAVAGASAEAGLVFEDLIALGFEAEIAAAAVVSVITIPGALPAVRAVASELRRDRTSMGPGRSFTSRDGVRR